MSSANGTGTKYYGRSSRRTDGSFIATRWLVLFWVPVLPLGSARLHDVDRTSSMRGTVRFSQMTFRAETVPLHKVQVMRTYALALVLTPLAWVALTYVSSH